MIPFTPVPDRSEWPTRVPSPFDQRAVHPLAQRAAHDVQATLRAGLADSWQLHDDGNGKMFGVLVVATPDGIVGYLRGFSGMVNGRWDIDGWVPPTFDASMRDAVWSPGEIEMRALAAQRQQLLDLIASDPGEVIVRRTTKALRAFDDARTARSRELMRQIQDSYTFRSARGDARGLRSLFAPGEPPAGAGDCAAPKLLAHAYRLGLRPLALAEFWWGAPPRTGDRRAGVFYTACRGKCLPILTYMLDGLPVDAPPLFGAEAIDASEPRVVHEDEHLLVVNKPNGLLSVPGRSALLQDSVATRLKTRYPDAPELMLAHRLDLDTSGLLLVAKNRATGSALQRLFSLREVDKRYIAWLNGDVADDRGRIALPLRVDIDDRPRNIHDPVHGKPAETEWEVLSRTGVRTLVGFTPHTGRTHQLRVHAAHPLGLDAPIVGDRLYGRTPPLEGERLLLHAERLAFVHPATGATVQLLAPAPF
jgi:tRNA pseudouridine32 synthase/23S rRNA pseudouridine746 synthase